MLLRIGREIRVRGAGERQDQQSCQ